MIEKTIKNPTKTRYFFNKDNISKIFSANLIKHPLILLSTYVKEIADVHNLFIFGKN